jgi:exodeoxyribonuclease V
MFKISQKTLISLDERYGNRWQRKNFINFLGGDWPLVQGWQRKLIGNQIEINLDEFISSTSIEEFDIKFPKIKWNKKEIIPRIAKKPTFNNGEHHNLKHNIVKHYPSEVTLTEEQMSVVTSLLDEVKNKQIQTLGGYAGTGKTTVISYLAKKLPKYACCAFTGKASEVLRSKHIFASTIHSLIYDCDEKRDDDGVPIFIKKDSVPFRGFIVDEASMIGQDLYNDLTSFNLPIIFVGDHGQLEPVGDDIYLMKSPDYKLETIHRNAGDISYFAHHIRNGGSVLEFNKCDSILVIPKSECYDKIGEVDQIICGKNNTRVNINKYIRNKKGFDNERPISNDRVISLQNRKKLGIYNGTQGIIKTINSTNMSILTDDGRIVKTAYHPDAFNKEKKPPYDPSRRQLHPFDYAYAITCHKSQGSEWNRIMVIEENCYVWDQKRWNYTAASRAKEKLIWVYRE